MGVPKFFRYISERYPCLSELIKEHEMPEFDNLYLDMNCIIHVCSHPNDFDPHFRITEEKIFLDIFHYLEILFNLIKPKKLFFMAVDGVAPRAKMNQQRGRRFKSAKEAEILEKEALKKGEKLPSQARFDSNCITPGTVFMDKLHKQLQYFVTNKVTNDPHWQECTVILSGHETPGEGEHKIMDYIRYMKSKPDYDPNTRHCLYGLDADLIMLGMCSHEPHFSLLREEVRYGKQEKRIVAPEETNFYLLHLSLLREYLGLEFLDLKPELSFEYDIEKIIDDWVLMGFLVGNDFIPHLHNLHINKGALPLLYELYKKVLPKLDGYINENGTLNLKRFQVYMEVLAEQHDYSEFEETNADLTYFKSKTGRDFFSGKDEIDLMEFDTDQADQPPKEENGETLNVKQILKRDPNLSKPESGFKSNLQNLISATEEELDMSEEDEDEDTVQTEFRQFKSHYYTSKMNFTQVTEDVLRSQCEGYIRAIQWILSYYYHGCQSWSWYYPHHYAPFASDIRNFENLKLEYDMAKPFLPFQQLLAVLPPASKTLLPEAYHKLMIDDNSPVIDYYPTDFETDLNGKQQEWEAVVLIPFIDEIRLLSAMESCSNQLSQEERQRNRHGPMNVYNYTETDLGYYESPEHFPSLVRNHAKMQPVDREVLLLPKNQLLFGPPPGSLCDVYFPGFPTLKHLPHTGKMVKANVKVFNFPSKNESILLELLEQPEMNVKEAAGLINREIYVSWPHLSLAKVVGVGNDNCRYVCDETDQCNKMTKHNKIECETWSRHADQHWQNYRDKLAVDIGQTNILVYACRLEGTKYMIGPKGGKVVCDKQWSHITQSYPLQTTVRDLKIHESVMKVYDKLSDLFPTNCTVFMLGHPYYGSQGRVLECDSERVKCSMIVLNEPYMNVSWIMKQMNDVQYFPSNQAAQRIGVTPHLLSRLTGNVFINIPTDDVKEKRVNIGLCLKFSRKEEEIPGYTKKDVKHDRWMYSAKAIELICDYIQQFPIIVDYLATNVTNDVFYLKKMFPEEGGEKKVEDITEWIKSQEYTRIEKISSGAQLVDRDSVKYIEDVVDKFQPATKTCVIAVKPHLLYKSDLIKGNVPPNKSAIHALFDRVVSVKSSYTVPLGLKGFIIGIHGSGTSNTQYDVLFDEEFVGGLQLNGASGPRCYRTSHCTFVNITNGERSVQYKMKGKPNIQQQPQQQQQQQRYVAQSAPTTNNERFDFQNLWASLQQQQQHLVKPAIPPLMSQQCAVPTVSAAAASGVAGNSEMDEKVKNFFSQAKNYEPNRPSAVLFSYFQSLNRGIPKYNFLEHRDGKIVAQIQLPNGENYMGQPSSDKQRACDTAASKVLEAMGIQTNTNPDTRANIFLQALNNIGRRTNNQNQPENWRRGNQQQQQLPQQQQHHYQQQRRNEQMLPKPPHQWFVTNSLNKGPQIPPFTYNNFNISPAFQSVQQQQQQQQQQQYTYNNSNRNTREYYREHREDWRDARKDQAPKSTPTGNSSTSNDFVPLQAITGQRVRGAIPVKQPKQTSQVDEFNDLANIKLEPAVPFVSPADPQQPRKSRIAAKLPGFNL